MDPWTVKVSLAVEMPLFAAAELMVPQLVLCALKEPKVKKGSARVMTSPLSKSIGVVNPTVMEVSIPQCAWVRVTEVALNAGCVVPVVVVMVFSPELRVCVAPVKCCDQRYVKLDRLGPISAAGRVTPLKMLTAQLTSADRIAPAEVSSIVALLVPLLLEVAVKVVAPHPLL